MAEPTSPPLTTIASAWTASGCGASLGEWHGSGELSRPGEGLEDLRVVEVIDPELSLSVSRVDEDTELAVRGELQFDSLVLATPLELDAARCRRRSSRRGWPVSSDLDP